MERIKSIDVMRGLVIVLMALDHVRDLLHTTSVTQNPLDFNSTTPVLFMTRWITHLCAPTFVFLAGTSAYLTLKSQQDLARTGRFLRQRGLFLIILELTVVGFGIWFDLYFRTFMLQVIFAIGAGFFILSFLLKVPPRTVGVVGLLIICLHNLLPALSLTDNPAGRVIWSVLFRPDFFEFPPRALLVSYPVVPWLGIMLFGFGFGLVFELPAERRRGVLWRVGALALLVFVLLRALNGYGDPVPWTKQSTPAFSMLSFINVTKYPPSLLYTLVMLGSMFLLLSWIERVDWRLIRILATYGRVSLFFYIIHWYVIHLTMFAMIRLQGVGWSDMPFGVLSFGRPAEGVGLELPYVYLVWLGIVALMYPLCRWYGRYKAQHRELTWLKYI